MYEFGTAEGKVDKVGRIHIPARLRKGLGKDVVITRFEDKLIIRQKKKGAFLKHLGKYDLSGMTLDNLWKWEEAGAMGNIK